MLSPAPQHPGLIHLTLLLLGAAAVAGWSPLDQFWVAWLAFAVLTACLATSDSPSQAFTRGYCFALGFHTAGHGWAFHALLYQTEAGLLWSFAGTALLLGYLSLFLAVPALAYKWIPERMQPGKAQKINRTTHAWMPFSMVLAIAWTAGEALRGMWFNGFDSLAAGYLFSDRPLRGWVPLLGVYGCSLLFYTSAALAGAAWSVRHSPLLRATAVGGLSLILMSAGGAALDTQQWVQPIGSPLSFRLIQGGVPQKTKFDANERESQVSAYVDAITAAPADLIVTPETAFTEGLTELNPGVLSKIRNFSTATGSNIFVGTPHLDSQGGIRNSMFHIAPGSPELPRYDKARLMPFGEYAPAGFGWFTRSMSVALSDQIAGSLEQPPFQARARNTITSVGTLICHEDLSNSDARQKAPAAHLFINPGNLAWFAGTLALPQRLQVAQVRALETGRPVLRISNTGVTAHIDEQGRVLSRLPEDQAAVLHGFVQPTTGLTPFAKFGHWPAVSLAIALLASVAMFQLRKNDPDGLPVR
jgi:apolipoprotein N-acyltransferase